MASVAVMMAAALLLRWMPFVNGAECLSTQKDLRLGERTGYWPRLALADGSRQEMVSVGRAA